MNRLGWLGSLSALACCAVACGGGGNGGGGQGGSTGGGSAGAAGDNHSGSGGSAGAESAGGSTSAGSAGTGSGGATPTTCTGTYKTLQPILLEDAGFSINGPTLPADELELFYVRGQQSPAQVWNIVRRTRASKSASFGPYQEVTEVAQVCSEMEVPNADVSDDGLTLYVSCSQDSRTGPSGTATLHVARRPNRTAPFVLDASTAGSTYPSPGISADELSAYSGGPMWNSSPHVSVRAAKTEPFGEPMPVPGITLPLNSPDISADGLSLFGSAPSGAVPGRAGIFRSQRASTTASFDEPVELSLAAMPTGVLVTMGAPTITASCTLYAVVVPTNSPFTLQFALPE